MQEPKKSTESLNASNFYSNYHFDSKYSINKNSNNKPFKKECPKPFDFSYVSTEEQKNERLIYVHSSKRNTRLTFCGPDGSHIFSYTMGSLGNKKSKRGNVYFVKDLCLRFMQELEKHSFSTFVLCINGFGRSRRPIVRFFSKTKLRYKCSYVIDVTPKPHNGCRLRSSRRL
jgi:small subunit ribosomal protein S11